MLKKGTLMDATLVVATHAPPKFSAGAGVAHPRAPGASGAKKNGRAQVGYKVHVGVDRGSGLVRRAELKKAGIKDRIAKRRHKSGPALSPRQKLRNDLIARRRAPVEGVFARNTADLFAALTMFNLKRAVVRMTP